MPVSAGPRLSKPVPRTLTAFAEIAAALATGDSVGAVMPGILTAVASELDGTQASLWLRGLDGLRRAWTVAGDDTLGASVEEQLRAADEPAADGAVVARLVAGRSRQPWFKRPGSWRLLVRGGLELVGARFVGMLSYALPPLFAHPAVWSHFGSGYGYVPLALPLIGLWWRRKHRRRPRPHGPPNTSRYRHHLLGGTEIRVTYTGPRSADENRRERGPVLGGTNSLGHT